MTLGEGAARRWLAQSGAAQLGWGPSRWGPGTIGDHRAETMGRPSRGETIEDTHRETIEDTHRGTIEDTHGIACTVLNE